MTETNPETNSGTNTDKELFREVPGDYYSDSLFYVSISGKIGLIHKGRCREMPIRDWLCMAETFISLCRIITQRGITDTEVACSVRRALAETVIYCKKDLPNEDNQPEGTSK